MAAIAYVTEFGLFARDGFFSCLIDQLSAPSRAYAHRASLHGIKCTVFEFIFRKMAEYDLVTQTSYRCKGRNCKAVQKFRISSELKMQLKFGRITVVKLVLTCPKVIFGRG
jgi:hypothetical protein